MNTKKINQGYKNYIEISKYVSKENHYILSGRYKFMKKKYKLICKDIFEKLEINKNDDIFDIGTGDGEIIKYLSKKSKSATTIDSPEVIGKILKSKKIKYLKGNIHSKGKKIKKRFDKILVYSVIQYFYNLNEVYSFLNLCLKLLKKSGSILIGDIPNSDMDSRYRNTQDFKIKSQIFDNAKKFNFSNTDRKFHQLFVGNKKTIKFSDKKLLFLLKKFNSKNYESYLLPQNKALPYSVNRVDLLIRKRS